MLLCKIQGMFCAGSQIAAAAAIPVATYILVKFPLQKIVELQCKSFMKASCPFSNSAAAFKYGS